MEIIGLVFGTRYPAEPGDKTQLATLLFDADREGNKWLLFTGASRALVATSALGVVGGALIAEYISERTLRLVAGGGFTLIGVWTLGR